MRRLIPAIVLTLFLTAVIPLTYYLVQNRQVLFSKAAPTAVLSLTPASGSYGPGDVVDVAINLDPGNNAVYSIDITISYDRTKFQVVDAAGQPATQISATGTFLGSPTVLTNRVNNSSGRIEYSIATLTSYTGPGGSLGAFKLKVLPGASGSSVVKFEPAPDTKVVSPASEDIVGSLVQSTFTLGSGQGAALDCTGVTLSPNSLAVTSGAARSLTAAATGGTEPYTFTWAVSSAGAAKGNF